jgi:hypothetical protein
MISEQYARAKEIIAGHRVALDKIGEALIEHETIEGKHVKEILEFGEIRSPIVNEPLSRPADQIRQEGGGQAGRRAGSDLAWRGNSFADPGLSDRRSNLLQPRRGRTAPFLCPLEEALDSLP